MSINMETLELYNEWERVRAAFVAAKEKGRDSKEYKAAAEEMREMRTKWRQIREAMAPEVAEEDTVVAPEPVKTTGKAKPS